MVNEGKRNKAKKIPESANENKHNIWEGRKAQKDVDRKETTADMPAQSANRHRRDGIC